MIEGLWTAQVRSNVSNISQGFGVLILRDGRIYGGNSLFFHVGSYTLEGETVRGEIVMKHYGADPLTIFGLVEEGASALMEFSGTLHNGTITVQGALSGQRSLRLEGALTRQAGPEIF